MMRTICILIALLAFSFLNARGDEPHWNPAERMEIRDAVITGEVMKINDLGEKGKRSRLMSAEIKILTTPKTHPEIKEKTITVFYEGTSNGSARCPSYPALVMGQKASFYLTHSKSLTEASAFVIEIGSDVINLTRSK